MPTSSERPIGGQLDWSDYKDAGMGDAYADIPKQGGHFAKAVAVCINSRQCEGDARGVMCPSYRVSGEAELSTGGRVRLLKAALNQEELAAAEAHLDDPALARAMDLCVSCKGCKRECENSVDMAAIKLEYRARQNARHGISRRSRLFARLPFLLQQPGLAPLLRWRNRLPWVAKLGEKLFGITADLHLPELADKPFNDERSVGEASAGEVVLLLDCFARHFEPGIAEATVDLLTRGGYRVHILQPAAGDRAGRPLCCGRTLLGQGMVEEARHEAERLLAALAPHLEAGRTLVGLEPSCLLTLRDEFRVLGLGEAALESAAQAQLLEEFLARELKAKRLNLPFADASGQPPLLVHGHCHQKAVGSLKALRKVLKEVPGLEFDYIEASCCGMAGSFGHEGEHRAMSVAMAEQALMPALRAAPAARIVASGFSCRGQIRSLGDARAVHLAVMLRDALVKE